MKYEQSRVSLDAPIRGSDGLRFSDQVMAPERYEADYGIRMQERRALVQTLLKQLTPRERQVIDLYYWENYTQQDIAGLMHCSHQRIAQTLDQAIRRMRKYALAHNLSP